MGATVILEQTKEQAVSKALEELASLLRSSTQEQIAFGLCGGRSIVTVLEGLAGIELGAEIWGKIRFFMIDERLVPLDHEESNFRLVSELCLNRLLSDKLIQESQLYPFAVDKSEDAALAEYQASLESFGGKFDVAFLGVGEDAHVAALFPEHHSFKNDAEYFITLSDSPKPPPQRVTASRNLIARSSAAFALFFGEGKREAFEKFNDPGVEVEECPAKLINDVECGFVLSDLM